MKLTKEQLKQIIKEELKLVMQEEELDGEEPEEETEGGTLSAQFAAGETPEADPFFQDFAKSQEEPED